MSQLFCIKCISPFVWAGELLWTFSDFSPSFLGSKIKRWTAQWLPLPITSDCNQWKRLIRPTFEIQNLNTSAPLETFKYQVESDLELFESTWIWYKTAVQEFSRIFFFERKTNLNQKEVLLTSTSYKQPAYPTRVLQSKDFDRKRTCVNGFWLDVCQSFDFLSAPLLLESILRSPYYGVRSTKMAPKKGSKACIAYRRTFIKGSCEAIGRCRWELGSLPNRTNPRVRTDGPIAPSLVKQRASIWMRFRGFFYFNLDKLFLIEFKLICLAGSTGIGTI